MKTIRKFTVIELLVVIAIISILASMLLPQLYRSRKMAIDVTCISNLRQIGLTWGQYWDDNRDLIPITTSWTWFSWGGFDNGHVQLTPLSQRVFTPDTCGLTKEVFKCPADNINEPINMGSWKTVWNAYATSYSIWSGCSRLTGGKPLRITILKQLSRNMLNCDTTAYARVTASWSGYSTGNTWHAGRKFVSNSLFMDLHAAPVVLDSATNWLSVNDIPK